MAAKSKKRKGKSQLAPEIQAAIDHGIDISALKANLRLSVAERLRQHQIALNTVRKLQKAKLL
jgi:hypothetical protein